MVIKCAGRGKGNSGVSYKFSKSQIGVGLSGVRGELSILGIHRGSQTKIIVNFMKLKQCVYISRLQQIVF